MRSPSKHSRMERVLWALPSLPVVSIVIVWTSAPAVSSEAAQVRRSSAVTCGSSRGHRSARYRES
nr:hypothetical protein [Streptomyces solincola]